MTLFKTLAITFSRMMIFTGITSLYGSILQLGRPAGQPRAGLGHHLLLHLVNGCRHVGDFSLPLSEPLTTEAENEVHDCLYGNGSGSKSPGAT